MGVSATLMRAPNDPIVGDLTGDAIVDAADLAALLGHWGPID